MSEIMLGLVGDVLVDRDQPAEAFSQVGGLLDAPDILFANLEGVYTDDPRPLPTTISGAIAPAHNLDVYSKAGFNVMSLANNHILDAGYEAMLDTRSRLRAQGVQTCGAGDCSAAAREPAIVEAGGLRVAFLAYASVFPVGYEARSNRPGLAPMRAYNLWREAYPAVHLPGAVPLVQTVPDETDLARLAEDIGHAGQRADLVVASFHWGDYTRPFHLTDHETRTARYCIDQGADMVVGHHHHALRGMEWYRGKPIMYGLGHFVFDLRMEWSEDYTKQLSELNPAFHRARTPYTTWPRAGWPLLPMHEDTRMTVFAWATASRDGIGDIGFLPCRLTSDGVVHPLAIGSAESDEVVRYLEECNESQALGSRIVSADSVSIAGFRTHRVHGAHGGAHGERGGTWS
jgi:poly-gamma-glutamate capsule biosynthesis protein CapA/YwtB (metallophosphatase superfamily)